MGRAHRPVFLQCDEIALREMQLADKDRAELAGGYDGIPWDPLAR